jgi:hypothetical protein
VHAPRPVRGLRIVATPAALDAARWPAGSLALRLAPDDLLLVRADLDDWRLAAAVDDPEAIVEDDAGFAAVVLEEPGASALLPHVVEWPLPADRPALAQGALAGLPAKLWCEEHRVVVLVPAPFAVDLEERLREVRR